MSKIIDWLKRNWLLALLIGYVLLGWAKDNFLGIRYSVGEAGISSYDMVGAEPMMAKTASLGSVGGIMPRGVAPVAQEERMVVQDTNMSLLVKDVAKTIKTIEKTAAAAGGYMVNKYLSKPEGAASGNITMRVPIEKREDVLDEIRSFGVKVVSENVHGTDVTDSYVDLEARLANLNRTKAKMEAILDQATRVDDLMNVQTQINSIQMQIDSLKGQQKYLEQTAKLTLISVNLSTDELALPYAPDGVWRPEVVFKNAVRSMLGTLRSLGNLVIWAVVYIPVLAIIGLVVWVVWMVRAKLNLGKKQ